MGLSTLHNVRYRGMATCVPKHKVSNLDCPSSKTAERERLARNIGIFERRICPEWQCFSDLAVVAAERLLAELAWAREDVDALITVTQSPDYLIPSTAIILQDRLGLRHTTIAFDVNLGCSAYPFALHLVGSMIAAGTIKKALVLVGDRSGSVREPLFSDAATATALEYDPAAPPVHFDLNSDGSGFRAIMLPVGGHREPAGIQHFIPFKDATGEWRRPDELQLDGAAVLSFSTQRVPPAVKRLMDYAGAAPESIDYFVFHQANRMINETIRKKLGLPPEKVPSTLHDFGNTSGASIPVTMTVRIRDELLTRRHRVLMSGFGIGLSWGTALVEIEGAIFPELIEA
ncbi:ketoacyl-ACP synthase III [Gemmatimonas sp.]|jgi:3-oxoacyl-[acyl-carrier-protein] synthase-3|uniref:ketoacyl-ACP synthase III n=1 Tax=Gemmatimonas sp. TaxID=1962908 RepID=UPI0031BCD31F|nr:ketoacyl-ACP synthase III [Gemmatimonas sp.]